MFGVDGFGVGAVFSFWWGVGVFDTVACFGWGCCVFCFLLEGGVWCALLRCFLSCLGFCLLVYVGVG